MIEILRHCVVDWNVWCGIWEFIVALTVWVVQVLWGTFIWEDGSYGDADTVHGCLAWLQAGCR